MKPEIPFNFSLYTQASKSVHKEPWIFSLFKITARRFRYCLCETEIKERNKKSYRRGVCYITHGLSIFLPTNVIQRLGCNVYFLLVYFLYLTTLHFRGGGLEGSSGLDTPRHRHSVSRKKFAFRALQNVNQILIQIIVLSSTEMKTQMIYFDHLLTGVSLSVCKLCIFSTFEFSPNYDPRGQMGPNGGQIFTQE